MHIPVIFYRILNKSSSIYIIDGGLNLKSSFFILIWLNIFAILSPYTSAYASMVDYPTNISKTPGNIIIEQDSLNPQVASYEENVYVVWEEHNGELAKIYFTRSTDGGASFDKTINLSNTTGKSRNPNIAVSGNTVYVTWLQNTENTISIYFTRSTDGGASFDKTINLSNILTLPEPELDHTVSSELDSIIEDSPYPSIVASGSNVYLIWLGNVTESTVQSSQSILNNSTNSTTNLPEDFGLDTLPEKTEVAYSDIFYKRSTDGGASFDKTINLTNNITFAFNPQITVTDSNVYLVWNDGDDIYFRRSTDRGTSFEPIVNVINNSESNTSWLGNPRVSASDTDVYIIYQQSYAYSSSSSEERKKPKLFFTASNNTGTTFGRPIMLSDNNGVKDSSGDIAQIYSSGSSVYVIWPTDTIDRGQDVWSREDMYFRRSTDGGASFEPIVNLSESIIKGSSGSPTIVANGSILYMTWDVSVKKEVPYYGGEIMGTREDHGVVAKSTDGGSNFDLSVNATGSNSELALNEGNASLVWTEALNEGNAFLSFTHPSVWTENREIFFTEISPTSPLSSLQHSKIQEPIVIEQTPILIDAKIGSTEWERIPSSSLEQLNGTDDDSGWERIQSDFKELNDREYQVKLASTSDNNNSYFVVGVQGTDFKGGSNIVLMFDDNDNRKLDNGEDILKVTGGFNSTSSADSFQDSFWNNVTNEVQKDEDYGGKEDGYAASSFYNDTEVFEVSHPLCPNDINHDYCITFPDETLGFALELEINGSSTLLFFNEGDNEMLSFSLSKGGVYEPCPGCAGAPLTDYVVPPATFILEPFQRSSMDERAEFLDNLTREEQTKLLASPTLEEVQNFLINKLTGEELANFLINKLTGEKLDLLFKEIPKDDILNRLSEEDRNAVSEKLSSFELTS